MNDLSVSYNFTFNELPKCSCETHPVLAPVMDLSQDGTPYLKGWFCPACGKFFVFVTGEMKIKKASDWVDKPARDR